MAVCAGLAPRKRLRSAWGKIEDIAPAFEAIEDRTTERHSPHSVFLVPVDDRSSPSLCESLDGPNRAWFGVSRSRADTAAQPGRTCPGPETERRGCCSGLQRRG